MLWTDYILERSWSGKEGRQADRFNISLWNFNLNLKVLKNVSKFSGNLERIFVDFFFRDGVGSYFWRRNSTVMANYSGNVKI